MSKDPLRSHHRLLRLMVKSLSTMSTRCGSAKITLSTAPYLEPSQHRCKRSSPPPPLLQISGILSLQYLSFTRPDIAFPVNRLAQFLQRPTDLHWQAVKQILRYLAGTSAHGILIRPDTPLKLHAYSDADWAGDADDYCSTNAYIVYLGSNPISWSSKKQTGVARSSTEAEYRAVANATAELLWVCSLFTELRILLPEMPVIYCDNVGATHLAANLVFHSKMKHIALDFHFIRHHVQSGALRVSHLSTKDQLADALTKPLPRPCFQELMCKIGITHVTPS